MTFSDSLLRPDVAALPAYTPGARPPKPATRAAEHDAWSSELHTHSVPMGPIKLSSNENPYSPLPAVVSAIEHASREINRYPDMMSSELLEMLAAKYGVNEDQITIGNGSVAVLAHVLAAVVSPGDEVVYPWRSFEAYPICVSVAHGVSVPVPIKDDGQHDFAALAAAITPRTKVVIVCSPNNPTGTAISQLEFINFMNNLPSNIVVILDEAYAEFVRDPAAVNGLELLSHYPNLITLRTMSKAYGLAGLRIGFAIGSPELIAGVRAVSTPFGVNSLAQAAAVAALNPAAERVASARVAALVAERSRVVDALRRRGWDIPDAQGNFIWLPLGQRAKEFAEAASAEGLLVRPFNDDGINGGVRVTIAEGAANNHFLAFAEKFPR